MFDLRKGTIEDIDELVRMRMTYIKEDFGEIDKSKMIQIQSSLPEYFMKHLNKDLFTYIACNNDRVIATVFLYVSEKPANPHNIRGRMGEVLNVVTEPDFRGQGIAEKLINMMLDDAKVMELSAVKLDATEMGKPVYQKAGFKPEIPKYTAMIYEI